MSVHPHTTTFNPDYPHTAKIFLATRHIESAGSTCKHPAVAV